MSSGADSMAKRETPLPALNPAAAVEPSRRFAERYSLDAFLAQLTVAIAVIDQNNLIVFANPIARDFLESPPDAILDRPVSGIIRICHERAKQRSPHGEYLTFENYFGGRWYAVQAYRIGWSVSVPGEYYSFISLSDITERKRREFEMLENMAGLEEATRIAQMGTFKLDRTIEKIEWSPHMYILHGVTPDRFKPTINSYAKLVYPEDRQTVAQNMNWDDDERTEGGFQYRIVKPDGALRWMYLDRRVLFNTEGEPYGVFGTVQDITETKQREQELQRLLRRNAILYEALDA